MRMQLIVNWVPYPMDSARRQAQRAAVEKLLELRPEWCRVVLAIMAGEEVPAPTGHAVMLPRDSRTAGIGERRLPFMKDILDLHGATYIGFLNSDIVVTPEFFTDVERMLDELVSLIIIHRTDVRHLDADPQQGRKVEPRRSCDGLIIQRSAWEAKKSQVPDFLLGAPWWDTAMIWWAMKSRLLTAHLHEHQCLHQLHERHWRWKDLESQHNARMMEQLTQSYGKD